MDELFWKSVGGIAAIVITILVVSSVNQGIKADRTEYIQFDPQEDSFVILQSWTDINCANDEDVQHLVSLWRRRESMIAIPFSIPFATIAIERFGNRQFRWTDLGKKTTADAPQKMTRVDLDKIQINPGEFYLNEDHNLCYFQETLIAGKTIDQILEEVTPTLIDTVANTAEEELRAIRGKKRDQLSWEKFRTQLLENINATAEHRQTQQQQQDGIPLDIESLTRLQNSKTDSSIKLSRRADNFSITLPLSANDCREILVTHQSLRDSIQQRIKDGKEIDPSASMLIELISMQIHDETNLELSMNVSQFAKATRENQKPKSDVTASEDLKTSRQLTVKSIENSRVEVNKTLSIEKVIAKYSTEPGNGRKR